MHDRARRLNASGRARSWRGFVRWVCLLWGLLWRSAGAHAAEAPAHVAEVPAHAAQAPARRGTEPFDVRAAQHYLGLAGARLFARASDARRYQPGFELRFVDALVWTRQWTTLGGATSISFRSLPGGYSFSAGQSGGFAGVHLGAVDLLAGVGLSLFNLDTLGVGWSASLGSPRSSASLVLHFESVRVELGAHLEYLWRWSGPDEYVRGIGAVISVLQSPIGPRFIDPL